MATVQERVNKDGSTRYRAQVRVGWTSPKSKSFSSREEAERWAIFTEERLKLERGRDQRASTSEKLPLIQTGVYLLWRGMTIVYIGHSNHILQRILQHHDRSKDFDAWSVIRCAAHEMLSLERELIKQHQPELNVSGKRK